MCRCVAGNLASNSGGCRESKWIRWGLGLGRCRRSSWSRPRLGGHGRLSGRVIDRQTDLRIVPLVTTSGLTSLASLSRSTCISTVPVLGALVDAPDRGASWRPFVSRLRFCTRMSVRLRVLARYMSQIGDCPEGHLHPSWRFLWPRHSTELQSAVVLGSSRSIRLACPTGNIEGVDETQTFDIVEGGCHVLP